MDLQIHRPRCFLLASTLAAGRVVAVEHASPVLCGAAGTSYPTTPLLFRSASVTACPPAALPPSNALSSLAGIFESHDGGASFVPAPHASVQCDGAAGGAGHLAKFELVGCMVGLAVLQVCLGARVSLQSLRGEEFKSNDDHVPVPVCAPLLYPLAA